MKILRVKMVVSIRDATMTTLDALFDSAALHARTASLPYAGALVPADAFAVLRAMPQARLVDVRTRAELDWVGRPAIDAGQYVHAQWNVYPDGTRNPDFLASLQAAAPQADTVILLLCRSAVRSKAAAIFATEHGFRRVYDVLEGFEGDKDAEGHRKSVGGWCFRGLPWLGA